MKKNIKLVVSIFLVISLVVFIVLFLFFNNSMDGFSKFISISSKKSGVFISNFFKDKNDSLEKINIREVDVNVEENSSNEVDENISDIKNSVEDEKVIDDDIISENLSIVYDDMTLEQLAFKLDRSLKNELAGKGYLYASYCLEKNVDPYLAVAISLEETGCNSSCSSLVKYCNNVGGMIGSGCNGFSSWPTLDDGIRAFIDNIYRNYVLYGLTDAVSMNSKYAENPMWATNVNNYINIIKNK